MMSTNEESTTNVVERGEWRDARGAERRGARRLRHRLPADAVSTVEEGALLDAFFPRLDAVGVRSRWQALPGDVRA